MGLLLSIHDVRGGDGADDGRHGLGKKKIVFLYLYAQALQQALEVHDRVLCH